ncbi:hypothetical protein [Acidithiobacillus ferriphilus]
MEVHPALNISTLINNLKPPASVARANAAREIKDDGRGR